MAAEGRFGRLAGQAAAFLEGKRAIALATCAENDVRVRTVSFASRGLEICFLTLEHNLKCRHIRANPDVALCRDNVQVEGRAEILGRADDPSNGIYADLLREKFPDSFDADAARPGMVIVRVAPRWVRIFRNPEGRYVVDSLDVLEGSVSSADLEAVDDEV
jgi:general stress protein 26